MNQQPHPMKLAVIFMRVSNQVPAHIALRSVETQRHACIRRANELNAKIIHEYVEYGPASPDLSKRAILLTMLSDLDRRRTVSHVITYDHGCLAHNAPVYVRIMQAIEVTGADIAIAALVAPINPQEVN